MSEPAGPAATRVAVLDYGIGNLRSAQKALEHVGARAELTSDRATIEAADAIVLPGVGSFGRCREALAASGLDRLAAAAIEADVPFLGICVGMQLLLEGSEESPGVKGLGVLPGTARRLPRHVKHPQMQWNRLTLHGRSPLFDGLEEPLWMYFVHSFAASPGDQVVATCHYGGEVTAAMQRGRVLATQFHPEKSGRSGLSVLDNFVRFAAIARSDAA